LTNEFDILQMTNATLARGTTARRNIMRLYANDPRWIPARFAGKCSKCGEAFGKGRMIFYYPSTKTVLSGACAIAAADDFDAAARDEAFYCGSM
jgi:hypothetical protein